MPRLALALAAAATLAACRSQQAPVQLEGSPQALTPLAGTWVGEYRGDQTGRGGSIQLRIAAAGDSAFGDVLMTGATNAVLTPADPASAHAQHTHIQGAGAAQLLAITFVRVARDSVVGKMKSYVAPDCACVVTTTFQGAVSGDLVAGRFITTGAGGLRQSGEWKARRERP